MNSSIISFHTLLEFIIFILVTKFYLFGVKRVKKKKREFWLLTVPPFGFPPTPNIAPQWEH